MVSLDHLPIEAGKMGTAEAEAKKLRAAVCGDEKEHVAVIVPHLHFG